MSNVWHGADPAEALDGSTYELATVAVALENATLNGIRVWSPASANPRANRKGHVWSMTGDLLGTIDMPTNLDPGWTTHLLGSPIALVAGQYVVVSYETAGNYGNIPAALGTSSHVAADGAMAFPLSPATLVAGSSTTGNGRYHVGAGVFPDSSFNHTWYGVDVDYTSAAAPGGSAPVITNLALSDDGLTVQATVTATDPDGLVGATYDIDWGDGATSSGGGTSFSHTYSSGGVKAILASVTDSSDVSGFRAGAVELEAPVVGLPISTILDKIVSHAAATGLFERVNLHEPKNAPGSGLSAAVWVDSIGPVPTHSGLSSTTGRVAFSVRLFAKMLQEPQDAVDPEMVAAVDVLMSLFSGDFRLGGSVRNVDLLGQAGPPLSAQAGYLNQDGKLFRVMTISLPVIVNDLWEQAP